MTKYLVNGRTVELPADVTDFLAFARECSSDQVVAMLGRVAVLCYEAGWSDAEVERAVGDGATADRGVTRSADGELKCQPTPLARQGRVIHLRGAPQGCPPPFGLRRAVRLLPPWRNGHRDAQCADARTRFSTSCALSKKRTKVG